MDIVFTERQLVKSWEHKEKLFITFVGFMTVSREVMWKVLRKLGVP